MSVLKYVLLVGVLRMESQRSPSGVSHAASEPPLINRDRLVQRHARWRRGASGCSRRSEARSRGVHVSFSLIQPAPPAA